MSETPTMEIAEVAKRLGVSTREAIDLIDTDQLPRVHDERDRVVVPTDAVEAYAAANGIT